MRVTKKHIQSVLRTEDITAIFKLHKSIYGNVNRSEICSFIQEYAPTQKVYKKAYDIAYFSHKYKRYGGTERYFAPLPKQIIVDRIKEEIKNGIDSYSKLPFMGFTHLYMCSPVYGHRDYNKWMALPIKGNEEFCQKVCEYAHKKFEY